MQSMNSSSSLERSNRRQLIGVVLRHSISLFKESSVDRVRLQRSEFEQDVSTPVLFDVEMWSDDVAGIASEISEHGTRTNPGADIELLHREGGIDNPKLAEWILSAGCSHPTYLSYILAVAALHNLVLDYLLGLESKGE